MPAKHYSILFQPNILDVFFWTLSIYFLVRYINSKNGADIYGIAISLALGWWSKYSILFMAVAIVIGILLTKHREMLLRRQTWFAVMLAFLLIVPNLWWQYQHNWPLIHHMKELRETQLQFLSPIDFLKDQVLMLLPVAFVWITGLVWTLKNSNYRIVGYIYLLVIVLLIAGNGKNYYALGAYPMLLAAGAVSLEKWSEGRIWKRYFQVGLIAIFTIPFIPLLLPTSSPEKLAALYKKNGIEKTGLLRWEDMKDHSLPQDFADMIGWKELTEKAETYFQSLPDSVEIKNVNADRHLI